jgi:hypothetical protein
MILLSIKEEAADDLNEIVGYDRGSAVRMLTFLQEAKTKPAILDMLLDSGVSLTPGSDGLSWVEPKKVWVHQRRGIPTWRLKYADSAGNVLGYRMLYLFEPVSQFNSRPRIHIVAVARREEIDYDDPNNRYMQRALRIWNEF